MDLGCGKGGDLNKFKHSKIKNYVGIDISIQQVRDCLMRKVKGNFDFPGIFIKNSGFVDS